jgi:hypothetical protein
MTKTLLNMVKHDLSNVQLMLLPLVAKTSSFVALYVEVSHVYVSVQSGLRPCVYAVPYIGASRLLQIICLGIIYIVE